MLPHAAPPGIPGTSTEQVLPGPLSDAWLPSPGILALGCHFGCPHSASVPTRYLEKAVVHQNHQRERQPRRPFLEVSGDRKRGEGSLWKRRAGLQSVRPTTQRSGEFQCRVPIMREGPEPLVREPGSKSPRGCQCLPTQGAVRCPSYAKKQDLVGNLGAASGKEKSLS